MARSGRAATQDPHPDVAAAASRIVASEIARLRGVIQVAGRELADAGVAGSPEVGTAAIALVVRDELTDAFDPMGLALMDAAADAAGRYGGTPTAVFRLVARLAGRTDGGARFAFGRPRQAPPSI